MKCYYTYDKIVGKVLIPGCWPVVHSNDMRDCSCRNQPETLAQFERKAYNEKLNEKNTQIKELEHEIAYLNRILRRVNGFR